MEFEKNNCGGIFFTPRVSTGWNTILVFYLEKIFELPQPNFVPAFE